jgi:hypothetical protein
MLSRMISDTTRSRNPAGRAGATPAVFVVGLQIASVSIILKPPRSQRAILFL